MAMMKIHHQIIVFCLALFITTSALADTNAFVTGFEDLPLMPGLVMAEEGNLEFDTPQGRIVESYAQGHLAREAVLSFYRIVLPQLGWVEKAQGSFQREGEALKLEFPTENTDQDKMLTVHFALSPYK